MENVQDALTQPGQWFLDRSTTPWTLTYLANTGENPNVDAVIIPQLPILLIASNIQYVTFQGLTLLARQQHHSRHGLRLQRVGTSHHGRGVHSELAAHHRRLRHGHANLGHGPRDHFLQWTDSPSWCLATDPNAVTAHNVIQNSAFYDLGIHGVRIGEPGLPSDSDANVPQFITVQNNVMEGYGRVIPAAFGIASGVGHDNLFTHNDVYDGYHCAISISQNVGDLLHPMAAARSITPSPSITSTTCCRAS